MKVLIPSYAAGSIIGKGGQTIVQLQKETGATIKLSKSKDFYPGNELRLCLNGLYPSNTPRYIYQIITTYCTVWSSLAHCSSSIFRRCCLTVVIVKGTITQF